MLSVYYLTTLHRYSPSILRSERLKSLKLRWLPNNWLKLLNNKNKSFVYIFISINIEHSFYNTYK